MQTILRLLFAVLRLAFMPIAGKREAAELPPHSGWQRVVRAAMSLAFRRRLWPALGAHLREIKGRGRQGAPGQPRIVATLRKRDMG